MTETNVFVGLMIRRVQIESKSKPGPFYRYNQSTEEIKDKSAESKRAIERATEAKRDEGK